jgi:hypothetical protein
MIRPDLVAVGVIALLPLSACGDDDDADRTVDATTTCDRVTTTFRSSPRPLAGVL